MLYYIRFVFFRPTSFHAHNPLSINANYDFTVSSCYVRFVLCPVFASVANSREGNNNLGMIEATKETIPGESDLIPKNWYDKLSKRINRVNMNINNNTGKK